MSSPTIAEILADFATAGETAGEAAALSGMRPYALDTLAVTLAGTICPSSRSVTQTILSACGKPEATVIGHGRVTSAWDAALANGAYAHALELDDDHRIAVLHPGAVVVPAALGACESVNATGRTFLRSILVGYEVMCRLGEVFRGRQFNHGVHPTALCGVFGAAAAAAVATGLSRDAFVCAMGIAGTQASGLTEWRTAGTWIKRLHTGRAAHTGVLSARLAAQGFTGPATIFEGPGGFFNAYSFGEEIHPEVLTKDLGREYHALGTALKPYPCCRFEHGAIDLAIAAHRSGVSADEIAAIQVRIYATGVLTYHSVPKDPVDAQFNVPYAIAVALRRGAVVLSDFTDEAIRRQDILSLAKQVTVLEDDEYTARYPDVYCVELRLTTKAGRLLNFNSECPSGDPDASSYREDPGLLYREAETKASSLLQECGFNDCASELSSAVTALPDADDLHRLTSVLSRRAY